jgi:anti-sigma regulatory factor (Ser/Thr protein kinase)
MDASEMHLADETLVMLRRLPTDQDAPGAARALAKELLDDLDHDGGERHEDLILSVSELVSNAVVHGPPGGLSLRLEAMDTVVRVEVSDRGHAPFAIPDGLGAEGHWGLGLVRQLSDRSGIERRPWTVAWCEIDLAG